MSTVIYLANQIVQIVEGSLGSGGTNLRKCISLEAPEGSIINGMIMDAEAFSSFLTEAFAANRLSVKDVILVVNSTKFIGRRMELPIMKKSQEYDYIARDYMESGRGGDNMLYGYITLGENKNELKKIYAEGVEEDFIRDYLDIFAKAGIKLKNIYSGESCLINYSRRICSKGLKNFLLLGIDGTSLIEILFVNGTFYYYNSVRCFQEPGTFEYGQDMARSVSQILQFMKSEQIEAELEKIVIAGASGSDIENYQEAFSYSGLEMGIMPFKMSTGSSRQDNVHEFFTAVSGFSNLGKNSDFYNCLKVSERRRKFTPGVVRAIVLIGTVFVVVLSAFIILFSIKLAKQSVLDKLLEYNEDPVVMLDVADYDMYEERNNFLKKEFRAIDELKANIATYPCGNTKIQKVIDGCALGYAEVEYNSFDKESGVFFIEAKAPLVDDINKFIKNLTEKDEFYKIDYTGYDFDEATGMWQIKVSCILAEGAGR